ncbi:MAG TPA: hypothetical protein ENN34_03645 [Deltaproteobacteria bacterium]|nr:hypothetical protein [Deltaproteobacteria bacterium]
MTIVRYWPIALFFVFLMAAPGSAAHGESRVFALTRAEMTEIVSTWLKDSGFTVSSKGDGDNAVEISATSQTEAWHIRLQHYSPLATRVEATHTRNGAPPGNHDQSLWNFLSGYLNGSSAQVSASSGTVPADVLRQVENVVCLDAQAASGTYQFSGFVVDTSGLILSTAHNLLEIEEIRVTLFDGTPLPGRIIKIDFGRDLALIDVEMSFGSKVHLNGRDRVAGMGERIYSVGCPENLGGTIYSGFINGPPRLLDENPLWQASMKVYPGSSGSPVFDEQGNLVAVVKGRHRGTDSMGFLIPKETIFAFIQDPLRKTPHRD